MLSGADEEEGSTIGQQLPPGGMLIRACDIVIGE